MLRFYFESVYSPQIFWVDLNKLNLDATGSVAKLDLAGIGDSGKPSEWKYSGEVSGSFMPSAPFEFISEPYP